MSLALYRRRVYFEPGRGGGMAGPSGTASLPHCPCLVTPLEAVDYAPEVRVAQARDPAGRWRDMTPAEVAAAERLIDALGADG